MPVVRKRAPSNRPATLAQASTSSGVGTGVDSAIQGAHLIDSREVSSVTFASHGSRREFGRSLHGGNSGNGLSYSSASRENEWPYSWRARSTADACLEMVE